MTCFYHLPLAYIGSKGSLLALMWWHGFLMCSSSPAWLDLSWQCFVSIARFIYHPDSTEINLTFPAYIDVEAWIIFCFIAIALIPIVYYLIIPFWHIKQWRDASRFWIGCLIYIICGPFVNIAILLYSCHYLDSFGWGKTRLVVAEDNRDENGQATERTSLLPRT